MVLYPCFAGSSRPTVLLNCPQKVSEHRTCTFQWQSGTCLEPFQVSVSCVRSWSPEGGLGLASASQWIIRQGLSSRSQRYQRSTRSVGVICASFGGRRSKKPSLKLSGWNANPSGSSVRDDLAGTMYTPLPLGFDDALNDIDSSSQGGANLLEQVGWEGQSGAKSSWSNDGWGADKDTGAFEWGSDLKPANTAETVRWQEVVGEPFGNKMKETQEKIDEAEATVRAREVELERLRRNVVGLQERLATSESHVQKLGAKLPTRIPITVHQQMLAKVEAALQKEKEWSQALASAGRESVEEMEREKKELREALQMMEDEATSTLEKLEVSLQRERGRADASENLVKQLEKEREDALFELESREREITAFATEIAILRGILQEWEVQGGVQIKELEELRMLLAEKEETVSRSGRDIAALRATLREHQECAAEAVRESRNVRDQLVGRERQVASLAAEVAVLREAVKRQEGLTAAEALRSQELRVALWEEQTESAKRRFEQGHLNRIQELEATVLSREQESDEIAERLEKALEERDDVMASLKMKEAELEAMAAEIASLQGALQEQWREVAERTRERDAVDEELVAKETHVAVLSKEVAFLRGVVAESDGENAALSLERDELKQRLEEKEDALLAAQQQVRELEAGGGKDVEVLREALEEREKRVEVLAMEVESLRDGLRIEGERRAAVEEQVGEMNGVAEGLELLVRESEQKVDEKKREMEELKAAFVDEERRLEELEREVVPRLEEAVAKLTRERDSLKSAIQASAEKPVAKIVELEKALEEERERYEVQVASTEVMMEEMHRVLSHETEILARVAKREVIMKEGEEQWRAVLLASEQAMQKAVDEKMRLQSLLLRKDSEIAGIEHDIALERQRFKEKKTALEGRCTELARSLEEEQALATAHALATEEARKALALVQDELHMALAEKHSLAVENSTAEANLASMMQRFANEQERHAGTRKELEGQLARREALLSAQVAGLEKALEEQQVASGAKAAVDEDTIAQLREEVDEIRRQFQLKDAWMASELQKLRDPLNEARTRCSLLTGEVKEKDDLLFSITSERDRLQFQVREMSDDFVGTVSQREVRKLKTELQAARRQVETMQKDRIAEKAQLLASEAKGRTLERELAKADTSLLQSSEGERRVERELSDLIRQKSKLQARVLELEELLQAKGPAAESKVNMVDIADRFEEEVLSKLLGLRQITEAALGEAFKLNKSELEGPLEEADSLPESEPLPSQPSSSLPSFVLESPSFSSSDFDSPSSEDTDSPADEDDSNLPVALSEETDIPAEEDVSNSPVISSEIVPDEDYSDDSDPPVAFSEIPEPDTAPDGDDNSRISASTSNDVEGSDSDSDGGGRAYSSLSERLPREGEKREDWGGGSPGGYSLGPSVGEWILFDEEALSGDEMYAGGLRSFSKDMGASGKADRGWGGEGGEERQAESQKGAVGLVEFEVIQSSGEDDEHRPWLNDARGEVEQEEEGGSGGVWAEVEWEETGSTSGEESEVELLLHDWSEDEAEQSEGEAREDDVEAAVRMVDVEADDCTQEDSALRSNADVSSQGVLQVAPARGAGAVSEFPRFFPPVALITLDYATGWSQAYIHYSTDGRKWTELPGEPLYDAVNAQGQRVKRVSLSASRMEFVINNGEDNWDRSPNGANYKIVETGSYLLQDGSIVKVEY